MTVQFNPHRT